ncbi:periplasmic chaperone for outer membrane proteins SurA [Luteimonas cucumeris]|uniref:Chaperone SurA n=1 Tax=Luteimonas cucumeris TaxID=985012 RepID=A0A562L4W7_9GAMM|nr:peptidylprolyl isomerase [Luteimonas cucumeris]TWI02710.1 periplasmic chaperone for outer membrane proteins SurA [Luteimonas cucumeris]
MKKILLSAFAAVAFAGTPAYAQNTQPIDKIAAVVDEDVILQSELDRAMRNVLAQYANRQDQLPPRDVLEKQVLERLILVRLQVARAERSGIRVTDEEVDQAVSGVASQNGISVDQLRQQLASEGISFPDFRATLRDEMVTQRLRQSFAQGRINVSEAEVNAALATQANAGAQYHLAHILVAVPDGATAEQIATGQKKIDGIKDLLDRGEMDFAAAAVRYSDSPNALEGGDLGWRSQDEIPTAFAEQIRTMQAGGLVGPLRGPSGFQLIKLVEVRDAAQGAPGTVTQYQARHILVANQDPANDAQAKARIDTLRARIAGGADFATVAQENSDDANTKEKGGDLGWFAQDAFGAEFGEQVASLGDGQVSAPFKTSAGWHIVQRVATRQTTANTDDTRRAQVRETIGRRKLEDEYNRYLREMRGEAYVDIRTGAAPAQPAQPAPAPAPAAERPKSLPGSASER